jgi:hypothetical protein
MATDDVRDIGQVTDVHGAPVFVAVWHGCVNLDGRMLGQEQMEELAQLLVRATWEAARHG